MKDMGSQVNQLVLPSEREKPLQNSEQKKKKKCHDKGAFQKD